MAFDAQTADSEARQGPARIFAENLADPEVAKVVAEARLQNKRQQQRVWVQESEIGPLFGHDKALSDGLSRLITVAQTTGFPLVMRTVRRDFLNREHPSIVVERFAVERCLERFDEVAQALGYRRSKR